MNLELGENLLWKMIPKNINNTNDTNIISNINKINKKGIKMKKSYLNYEKRGGDERQIKCKYRQKSSKKIQ